MKNVQIPIELFGLLCKYHLLNQHQEDIDQQIKKLLESKLEALNRRSAYTTYKTESDPEKKEISRKQYLDAAGVPEEYRW